MCPDNLSTEAFCYFNAGKWSEAKRLFQSLIQQYPMKKEYWFLYAATLQNDNAFKEATIAWAIAANLDMKNPYPHFHAAECLYSENSIADALLALKEAKERTTDISLQEKITFYEERWK